jgi:hypothetical protein
VGYIVPYIRGKGGAQLEAFGGIEVTTRLDGRGVLSEQ